MKGFASKVCALVGAVCIGAWAVAKEYNLNELYPAGSRDWGDGRAVETLTEDAIYNVSSSGITFGDFYTGQKTPNEYWCVYRGGVMEMTSNYRLMNGNVAFENAVILSGSSAENSIGHTTADNALGTLVLQNGGSLSVRNTHLRIGYTAPGVVRVANGSLGVTDVNLTVGNANPGALWIEDGRVAVTNGKLRIGYSTQDMDGYVRQTGGDFELNSSLSEAISIGGAQSVYSLYHLSGGTFRHTQATGGWNLMLFYSSGSTAGDLYIDGGEMTLSDPLCIGANNVSGGARATVTVDGEGRFNGTYLLLAPGESGTKNKSSVNLNGQAQVTLSRGISGGDTANEKTVNFDGGTLCWNATTRWAPSIPVVVYPRGGTLRGASSSALVQMDANLRAAQGCGVSSIALTAAGSGYVTAPKVTVSGGSGSNATAVAVLNRDGTLERIAVTCRGEGYKPDDELTVSFAAPKGSGAAATATLSENTRPTFTLGGSYTVSRTTASAFDGRFKLADGSKFRAEGSSFDAADFLVGDNAMVLAKGSTESSFGAFAAQNGVAQLKTNSDAGQAKLTFASLTNDAGVVLVSSTNRLDLALASAGTEGQVVNGLVYSDFDENPSWYRNPKLYVRGAGGSLSVMAESEMSKTLGENVKWLVTGYDWNNVDQPAPASIESLVVSLGGAWQNLERPSESPATEIRSGMIVIRRAMNDVQGVRFCNRGSFTTSAPGGMCVYSDQFESGYRSWSRFGNDAVYCGTERRVFGPFTDPTNGPAMSLTVAGLRASRPERGAVVWIERNEHPSVLTLNTYSGGLNLVNGGVVVDSRDGFGAAGSPIRAAGYCSIAARPNTVLNVSSGHPITLADNAALIFSPHAEEGADTVAAALSGSGALLTSDFCRPAAGVSFTGDHALFTGDYYVMGTAGFAAGTLSSAAGLFLGDGTNGLGVVETSGTIVRPLGTGKGAVCWKRHASMPTTSGLKGGFSAKGGTLAVNLGGAAAALVPGSDALPQGAVIALQGPRSDSALDFRNGFSLNGQKQSVSVWPGKTATLSGKVSDAVGGGSLEVSGSVTFAGELAIASDDEPLLKVDGDLTFSETASVTLDLDDATLAKYAETGFPIATATGRIHGKPKTLTGTILPGWTLVRRNGRLLAGKPFGMLVIVK